jgi:hypothetical protein
MSKTSWRAQERLHNGAASSTSALTWFHGTHLRPFFVAPARATLHGPSPIPILGSQRGHDNPA